MRANRKKKFSVQKLTLLLSSLLIVLIAACSDNKTTPVQTKAEPLADSAQKPKQNYFAGCKALFANASRMDSILLRETEVNKALAKEAIKAFTDFAFYCQSDSMSPVYLIKTAQVARVINSIPQAKLALDHCIENYPDFKDRPAAIFLLAQLYDEPTYLNNEDEAKRLYEKIISEYPKSDWVASAKGAMQMLGKTDAQILEELKKKKNK